MVMNDMKVLHVFNNVFNIVSQKENAFLQNEIPFHAQPE